MGWRLVESMLILLLLLSGCSSSSDPSGDAGRTGIRAPGQVDLQPMDLAGFRNLIARQRGKVVVVDVWATYCPPCMRDFHHLVTLHREADPQNVVCMSLNIDNQGLAPIDRLVPPVLKFLEKQKATFDNVLMTEDADQVYRKLGLVGIPAILVYDQQGRLVERVIPQGEQSPYVRVAELVRQLAESG
ncbi:MAG: TlpA disulfide reductase family protein [Planctomycetota bacterium]|nr:TlpA disulfide reductase family protein [Planctomycetota bacterium]